MFLAQNQTCLKHLRTISQLSSVSSYALAPRENGGLSQWWLQHSFSFTFSCWLLIQTSCKYSFKVSRKRAKFSRKAPNLFSGSMVSSLLVFHMGADFHFIPLGRSIIISSWRTELAPIIPEPRVWGQPIGIYPSDLRAAGEHGSQAVNQEVPGLPPEDWRKRPIAQVWGGEESLRAKGR